MVGVILEALMKPQPKKALYRSVKCDVPSSCSSHGQRNIYTVDSYKNGIEIGRAVVDQSDVLHDLRSDLHLSLPHSSRPVTPRTRHVIGDGTPFDQLERRLKGISDRGDLSSSWFYFGVASDPFHPFEGKFDATIKFLKIFQRYVPGMLFLQTRSPLVVLALSMLQNLGKHVVVTIALETMREDVVSRYTPGLPSVRERVRAASALKNFGVEVAFQVAPLLPYGSRRHDAQEFAELLCRYSDWIYIKPINDKPVKASEKRSGNLVVQSLSFEKKDEWLKPDAANPLVEEVLKIAPHKLSPPRSDQGTVRQMSFFVA